MDKETYDSFQAYFEMFATRGWGILQVDIEVAIANNAMALESAKDIREVGFLQGQIQKLRQLRAMEGVTKATFNDLKAEEGQ